MFGYILADRPELRVKDYHQYRGYYCGLCRAIASYGQCARFLLNYDCTFLYILYSALGEEAVTTAQKACVMHPLRKELIITDASADYVAAANILLGTANLQDKKQDRQASGAGVALLTMQSAQRKAQLKYPKLARTVFDNLQILAQTEKDKEADIDRAAHPFAQLLAGVFTLYAEKQKLVLRELGYQLGRWIYLVDAWADRAEDRQKDRYNVFTQKFGTQEDAAKESAEFNLKSAVNAAILAYDLLELVKNREILDNIVYRGITQKTEAILRGEKENKRHGSL